MRPLRAIAERDNVHIDGCEGSVGDGAADGTSESEARVQVSAGGRGRVRQSCRAAFPPGASSTDLLEPVAVGGGLVAISLVWMRSEGSGVERFGG